MLVEALKRAWPEVTTVAADERTKHSTGTALKTAGADDCVLARPFGHSDTRSVERYAKIQTEVIRSTLARLPSQRDQTTG